VIVVDAWPLTTIIAGNFAGSRPGNTADALRSLCRAGEVEFTPFQVEVLTRFITTPRGGWATTAHVATEAFHQLERCVGTSRFGEVVDWVRERLPPPNLVRVGWGEALDHPTAPIFGPADASIVRAAVKTRSLLLVQDGRLIAWCRRNNVSVRSCLDVAQVTFD
jgi:hypothetical protein